ncbi:hypothetical protein [Streptodolium elevatio]|uniref:Uncharacterized protein n=1 Tax=Streptodolium elevatio TaxID=3157996 RepID=A0ABV3D8S0_9ACTN
MDTRASWSAPLPATGRDPAEVLAVGDAVAVVAPDTPGSRVFTAQILDGATGAPRGTIHSEGTWSVATWRGVPALVVWTPTHTPASGLNPAKDGWTVTGYNAHGKVLGSMDVDALANTSSGSSSVEDGWYSTKGGDGSTTWAQVSDGPAAPGWRLNCGTAYGDSCDRRALEVTEFTDTRGMSFLVAGLVVMAEGIGDGRRLVVYDPASGARKWTSDAMGRPGGTDPKQLPKIVGLVGGRILVAWPTKPNSTDRLLTIQDPVTGAQVAVGPTITGGYGLDSYIADQAGRYVVACSNQRCTAWDTQTGQTLWQQAGGELRFIPTAIVGGVLYGQRVNDDAMSTKTPLALDVRTKQILGEGTGLALPTPVGTDHAAVTLNGTAYGFVVRTR